MDSNESQDNGTGFSPNVDAIQEFKLITTNAPAEYGNSMGAIVNTSLKSGTNQYHGSAFEFLKNDHLDANNWFSNASRQARGAVQPEHLRRHAWRADPEEQAVLLRGLSGHPAFAGLHRLFAHVIPAAWRTGDLSSLSKQLYNPLSQVTNANGTVTRAPFVEQSDSAVADQSGGAKSVCGYDRLSAAAVPRQHAKLDWRRPVQNQRGHRRYQDRLQPLAEEQPCRAGSRSATPTTAVTTHCRLNPTSPAVTTSRNGVITWNHTFSPSVLNEARVGVNRTKSAASDDRHRSCREPRRETRNSGRQQSRTRAAAADHLRRHQHRVARQRQHRRLHHLPVHRQPDPHPRPAHLQNGRRDPALPAESILRLQQRSLGRVYFQRRVHPANRREQYRIGRRGLSARRSRSTWANRSLSAGVTAASGWVTSSRTISSSGRT